MKHRRLLLTTLVALLTLFAAANALAAGWTFGVKGGATSATLHGNVSKWITLPSLNILTDLKDPRTGFAGGVFMNVSATPMFSVQVEALYAQKGGSGRASITRDNVTFIDADVTIELDYFEFPVVGMATFPAGPLGVNGYGGFSVGYNASSKAVVEIGGTTDSINIDALVKGADLSVVLGLGLTSEAGPVSIVVDGRFEYSLEDINSAGTGEIRNGTFFFMAGLTIPTGF
jgi:hypothetical protein